MPTIRLNKLAKDLKLGVNSLVEFLSKKRPTASYNPNSKLTAEEFDLVVKGLGHNLSDADKKSLIESHTKKPDTSRFSTDQIRTESHTHQPNRHSSSVDRQSKSGGIHGSTNNDLSKNDNRLAPRGPKVLGHVDLDSKGNVISAKPSPSSEKSDAKSVLIEGSKVANAVETKPDENLMPKAEEKVAQVPLDTTISKASEDDIKMARGIGSSKTAEDDVVKSSDDVVAESSVNETSKLIQDASPKKEELVTPNLEVKGSSNEEEKKEIPNATLSQSVDTKNVKIDSVSPVSDNTVVINTTEENASVTPVPEPTAKETGKKLASSEPTPSLDTPRAKTIVSKALPKDTSTPSANMSSVESTSDTNTAQESSETKKEDVIRIEAPELAGVKVVGHVDLSKMDIGRGPKRKEKRKRTVVKGGEKVDIEKQAKEQTGGEKRKQNGNQSQKGSSNGSKATDKSRTQGNNNGKSQEAVGRKAKAKKKQNQPAQPQSREVTQEEIQRQIKETMAAIQGRRSGSGNSAKYRRDKREERRRDEELQLQAEMEAGKQLQLTEFVTPNDLAQMMDVPVNSIISLVFNLGMMVSINQRLDKDTIELIVTEYGYEAVFVDLQVADVIEIEEDDEEDLEPRAPIVTVMGHVDHGKTSLLDAIRNTDVISHEAGGITQHVGAYRVTLEDDRSITFLDTPGHEAFTAMRARGAQVTDVVIIVVAADDGVMPQTKEAISHASLAGVPIVFAINKIDKPGANPDRIKEELANLNYLVEDWGGKYQSQEISAKQGIGVRDLLEKVLLEAEVLELKANPNKRALGSVLESTMEQGRGYTTKVLIQDGTLHVGDYMVAGSNYGRVKALFDDRGQNVQSVGPSEPVKVLGLNGATTAGETLNVMDSESEVRDIATRREQLHREQRERTQRMPSLMDLGRRIAEGKAQELNVIIKGDMDGSVEALADSIEKLSTDEIRVNVIYKAVGQITESDVSLASASDAVVIGFQVRPAMGAKRIAEENGVEIRTYSVIYDALDDVRTAMEGMLSPETKERVTASVEVRETFKISKVGTIAGCFVVEGKISRTDRVRVIRQGVVIHTGVLASLKRFKDDAKEVVAGLECGLSIQNYNDLQAGDELEVFQEYEVKRTLD